MTPHHLSQQDFRLGNCGITLRSQGEMRRRIRSNRMMVGGIDVHYLSGGEGDPLVVIHGGGDSARSWRKNLEVLAEHHTVYAPDLPGFGSSQPISGSFHVSDFVEFMEGFTSNLGLERFHLLGHSLGGGIALHFALKFPHKIGRLVLVSSMFLGREIALWARFLSSSAFSRFLGEISFAVFKAVGWLLRLLCAPFGLLLPFSRLQMSIGRAVMTLQGQTTVLLSRLSEVVVPTLLVWGRKDGILPASHAYAAAELIPDCQLHIFEDCGHSVYKQRVREVSTLLVDFLRKGSQP